jgi:hypothetical protein
MVEKLSFHLFDLATVNVQNLYGKKSKEKIWLKQFCGKVARLLSNIGTHVT